MKRLGLTLVTLALGGLLGISAPRDCEAVVGHNGYAWLPVGTTADVAALPQWGDLTAALGFGYANGWRDSRGRHHVAVDSSGIVYTVVYGYDITQIQAEPYTFSGKLYTGLVEFAPDDSPGSDPYAASSLLKTRGYIRTYVTDENNVTSGRDDGTPSNNVWGRLWAAVACARFDSASDDAANALVNEDDLILLKYIWHGKKEESRYQVFRYRPNPGGVRDTSAKPKLLFTHKIKNVPDRAIPYYADVDVDDDGNIYVMTTDNIERYYYDAAKNKYRNTADPVITYGTTIQNDDYPTSLSIVGGGTTRPQFCAGNDDYLYGRITNTYAGPREWKGEIVKDPDYTKAIFQMDVTTENGVVPYAKLPKAFSPTVLGLDWSADGDLWVVAREESDDTDRNYFYLETINVSGKKWKKRRVDFEDRIGDVARRSDLFDAAGVDHFVLVDGNGNTSDADGYAATGSGSGYYIVAGDYDVTSLDAAMDRYLRNGDLTARASGNVYEIRFLSNGNMAKAWVDYPDGHEQRIDVPFEVWCLGPDPALTSDHLQLVPRLNDKELKHGLPGSSDAGSVPAFNFGHDHQADGGGNDPYTDWIYLTEPRTKDATDPSAGYDKFATSTKPEDEFFAGAEHLARVVIMHRNGGSGASYDAAGAMSALAGKTFRITVDEAPVEPIWRGVTVGNDGEIYGHFGEKSLLPHGESPTKIARDEIFIAVEPSGTTN